MNCSLHIFEVSYIVTLYTQQPTLTSPLYTFLLFYTTPQRNIASEDELQIRLQTYLHMHGAAV